MHTQNSKDTRRKKGDTTKKKGDTKIKEGRLCLLPYDMYTYYMYTQSSEKSPSYRWEDSRQKYVANKTVCSVLQRVAACCSVLPRVAACCSVLQRVAACCSVLQRVGRPFDLHTCTYTYVYVYLCVCMCACIKGDLMHFGERSRHNCTRHTLQHAATRCNTL